MHLLGTSVLTLIILPLAFSCGHNKSQITEEYSNIIGPKLRYVVVRIEQLNTNCTVRNVNKELLNTQTDVQIKICKITRKLRKIGREADTLNEDLGFIFNKLVEEINESLGCWCSQKKEQPMQQRRKWKLCKVKNILYKLQGNFEQYNAYQSLNTDLPKRGKI